MLNLSRTAFPDHWPTEVKNTLSCDAFVFNLNNHDLMQKCICEKANLNHPKEIAKTDGSGKAAIQHFTRYDKGSAEIHQLRHKHHNISTSKGQYKHKCKQYQDHKGSPFKKCKSWNPKSSGSPSKYNGDICSRCSDSKHPPGFYCPAQKFRCQNCHKTGNFTHCCFKKDTPNCMDKPHLAHGITTDPN